jgi:hypothetical protein
MFKVPSSLEEYGKWYDKNMYPFNLKEISDYYLRHRKTDGTIDITKFDSTFHKNEISNFNNAIITRTWYKSLNTKINYVICGVILLYLFDVGLVLYRVYKKRKRTDDL